MRVESASSAKDDKTSRIYRQIPREGTRLRTIYDYFKAHAGQVIDSPLKISNDTRRVSALQDFYGLDIRCLGRRRWVLAGEWFGLEYRDYIAERLEKAE